MYYRNAAAAIVCFDITNEDSFTKMKDWVEELKQNVSPEQLVLAIACNKADLESQRVISRSRAEQFAQRVNAILYETSAKENFGVEEIFKKITEDVSFYFFNRMILIVRNTCILSGLFLLHFCCLRSNGTFCC